MTRMSVWIAQNLATMLISNDLILMIAENVVKLVKDKKKGKSSCGCNCGSCPMSGSCHSKK